MEWSKRPPRAVPGIGAEHDDPFTGTDGARRRQAGHLIEVLQASVKVWNSRGASETCTEQSHLGLPQGTAARQKTLGQVTQPFQPDIFVPSSRTGR